MVSMIRKKKSAKGVQDYFKHGPKKDLEKLLVNKIQIKNETHWHGSLEMN